uniref:Centromere protein S n=1 Tax=Timema californicum TaxID=61474 RepID=A0A7R9JL32_TIMCA|nr:unnamed protein product [Timema californicum]
MVTKTSRRLHSGHVIATAANKGTSRGDYSDTANESEVRKICLEAANKTNQNLDKEALDLIAELVWKKLRSLSQDLEHFAK